MTTDIAVPRPMVLADLKGKVDPDWCPVAATSACSLRCRRRSSIFRFRITRVCTISGIGCSSNFPGFINTYGMHTLHGRSLPVATGVKLANHELTVLVTGGDGDGFGIGCRPLCPRHAPKRRSAVHRDGQPDLRPHHRADVAHQPPGHEDQEHALRQYRNPDQPHHPCSLGGRHIRRARLQRRAEHLTELIKEGIQHNGFSFLDVFSPCVTYNHDNTYPMVPSTCKEAGRRCSVRRDGLGGGGGDDRSCGVRRSPSASSSSAPMCRHYTRLNRCSTRAHWSRGTLASRRMWRSRSSTS